MNSVHSEACPGARPHFCGVAPQGCAPSGRPFLLLWGRPLRRVPARISQTGHQVAVGLSGSDRRRFPRHPASCCRAGASLAARRPVHLRAGRAAATTTLRRAIFPHPHSMTPPLLVLCSLKQYEEPGGLSKGNGYEYKGYAEKPGMGTLMKRGYTHSTLKEKLGSTTGTPHPG